MRNTTENCLLLPQNHQLLSSMTILRSQNTEGKDFIDAFAKVAAQLMARALDFIPVECQQVTTPTGGTYQGVRQAKQVCGISILRAGASLEDALRTAYNGPLSFGKLLIQRDEKTSLPVHLYTKFPTSISNAYVLILEPMLATGGSVSKAIELVLEQRVPEEQIIVVNLIASARAVSLVSERFPKVMLVTAAVDKDLNSKRYIDPGLGDFGDRFYGT
ncbi:uracil phosphoribosyltransferase [Cladophialophora yegresii CBS 114405]|uniref:uracil phosphoribosyltransferase n=1 Tax=Cladophialophora yegresii CBS 114405 TaxID=1182544 RepID=W9WD06_9EURO|nr:uracil phosphoribosyltransferase [Cladophialophora yegresii CBS 114405]EXJ62441.1 uracil phosphoribosyltransferase [Cladophialophora yegresii CBS 114405]